VSFLPSSELEVKRLLGWLFGTGLVLQAFHRDVVFGITYFPFLGEIILWLVGLFLLGSGKLGHLGQKRLWVPLLVLSLLVIVRSCLDGREDLDLWWPSDLVFAFTFFFTYVIVLYLGRHTFVAFIPFVLVCSTGVILLNILYLHEANELGGTRFFLWPHSYTWLANFMFFGLVFTVSLIRSLYWRTTYALYVVTGIALTWAPLALLFFVGFGFVLLLKRDVSKGAIAFAAVLLIFCLSFWVLSLDPSEERIGRCLSSIDYWGAGRIPAYERALTSISVLGHNFDRYSYPYETGEPAVHSDYLLVLDTVGPIGFVAWVFVVGYSLYRRKWPYIWVSVAVVGILGGGLWVLKAYWWPALVALTHYHEPVSNYIFKKEVV